MQKQKKKIQQNTKMNLTQKKNKKTPNFINNKILSNRR